jgi:branched-chain amino acid aminotransferase
MPGSQDFASDPRNEAALVYLNGELLPRAAARVSIFDAGFVVGDGVWEGLRLHRGTLLFLEQHLQRLYWGAERIGLDIGMTAEALTAAIRHTLRSNDMHDGVHLRVMITRGEKSALNQDPRNALGRPTIVIVAEYKQPGPHLATLGLSLRTVAIRCSDAATFDMRLNSHSRLNLILALREAIAAGADEALMLDPHGCIASCNATNFFFVIDDVVHTATDAYCFNGITRQNVLNLCDQHRLTTHIDNFAPSHLLRATEAFVTGTFGGITPVREIDGRTFPGTLPGRVTQALRSAYQQLKDSLASDVAGDVG